MASEAREMVCIGTLREGERYNLAKADGAGSLTVNAKIELRPSPYSTATGRVLLACLSPDELRHVVETKGLPGDLWPEARDEKHMVGLLRQIREEGLAEISTPDGEVHTLAMPVLGPDGRAWAAIGIAVPAHRFTDERRGQLISMLDASAKKDGNLAWPANGRKLRKLLVSGPICKQRRLKMAKKCRVTRGCTMCNQCIHECPVRAITLSREGAVINEEKCIGCGKCIEYCASEAIEMVEVDDNR